MFGLTLQQIAGSIQGRLTGGLKECRPTGACVDTRKLQPGDLFFALPGEKTDGHTFLAEAHSRGAIAAVVKEGYLGIETAAYPLIFVEEPKKALQQLAALQRRQFTGLVVAVTGSTGKTTTKDMLSYILQERGPVLANTGNYNNELGLPLTLLGIQKKHWALILEMGMSGLGEIDHLAVISRPEYGIITNIGHTHQEKLGSQEKIAQAKAELISHIPVGGNLVLNRADRQLLKPWLSNVRSQMAWIGTDPAADFWAEEIREQPEGGLSFTLCSKKRRECVVLLPVPGRHNVLNALAAAALARGLGITWEEIQTGLSKLRLTSMRQEYINIPGQDILIINDTYNASPASMAAALELLAAAKKGGRAVAVLGNMYELGAYMEEGHLQIGEKAKESDLAYLITVGDLAALIARGAQQAGMNLEKIRSCQNNQEALCYLREILREGDVVLVKGSRGMRMEEIVAGLLSRSK